MAKKLRENYLTVVSQTNPETVKVSADKQGVATIAISGKTQGGIAVDYYTIEECDYVRMEEPRITIEFGDVRWNGTPEELIEKLK